MKQGIHSGIAAISLAFAAIAVPAIAGAQEFVLDASVEVGAEKSNKQYTVTIGKESTLETNSVYRIVMVPVSLSSKGLEYRLQMLKPSSGRLMAWVGGTAPLGDKKNTLMDVGFAGSPDRFKIDAIVRPK
jgi:hypothetical protein